MPHTNLPMFLRIYPEQAVSLVPCECGANPGQECISSTVPRTHHTRMDRAEREIARRMREAET